MIRIFRSRLVRNASWLIAGKIFEMALGLVISMITARYLGPANFGSINYAASLTAFFTSICTLGLNGILVKQILENPDRQGEILGTSIVLRLISSAGSVVAIAAVARILNPGDDVIVLVAVLYSLCVLFQAFDTLQYWYQSNLRSKVYTIIGFIAYATESAYKVYLLASGKSIIWFAVCNSIDNSLIAILLTAHYMRNQGQKLTFSKNQAWDLLRQSYHIIISGMAVAIYGQIATILVKHSMNSTSVGYYSAALAINNVWSFALAAIVDSARPAIMQEKDRDRNAYHNRIIQLYSLILYLSFAVALLITVLGKYIILILYGSSFLPALPGLRIISWYTAFSYLGVARSIWLVSEGLQRYEKYLSLIGAACSILLNVTLIIPFGVEGAAWATLATQVLTNFLAPFAFPDLRINSRMIVSAFNPKHLRTLLSQGLHFPAEDSKT